MLRILIILAVLSFAHPSAEACLNRYGTKADGSVEKGAGYPDTTVMSRLTDAPPQSTWIDDEARLREPAGSPNAHYQIKSDYATALIHLGRAREAIAILEPLVRQRPREYPLIANLGTAYELDGQLEKALEHISRGVELNSSAHNGSEWLHVNILEARIASARDRDWLKTHSVTGLSFGPEKIPTAPKHADSLTSISDAIIYQLHERLQFVQPRNQIVADLLFDLANIYAVRDSAEAADPIYQFALTFDEGRKPVIRIRAAYIHSLVSDFSLSRSLQKMGVPRAAQTTVILIGALTASILFFRRRATMRDRTVLG